jgi:NADH:ubiquinone oxidoreductase subunit 6 (subunit J)
MELFALTPTQLSVGQFALAAFLAFDGFLLLLPKPKGRSVSWGIAALIAAVTVFVISLQTTFGSPMPDLVGTILFWLFSLGALGFGTVLVVQRNPARGAIAFAFVILSTCGLFLLLAAPFLMAATIIIYAGAIIVTFLFVLMLSHPNGPSNENDRSQEPLLGALAGFAFVGLVLFALYLTYSGRGDDSATASAKGLQRLPAPVLTMAERQTLADVIAKLDGANEHLSGDLTKGNNDRLDFFAAIKDSLELVVGVSHEAEATTMRDGSIRIRLEKTPGRPAELYREDPLRRNVLERTSDIRKLNWRVYKQLEIYFGDKKGNIESIKVEVHKLRDEVLLLYGSAELPARNVENLGFLLYADHLLAIELAGTLLLVATIGAVAIAQRKGVPA